MIKMRFAFLSGTLVGVLYSAFIRPRLLTVDVTSTEANANMIGDHLIIDPTLVATRAITINAAPQDVWPWLAQMGRDRTGFYGADRITNWNIPSAAYIRHDIAPLQVGIQLDDGLQVLDFAINKYMVVGGFDLPNDLGGRSDFAQTYELVAIDMDKTRLIVRSRLQSDGWQGWLFERIHELLDYWMVASRLAGIKQRAEGVSPLVLARELLASPVSEG